MALKNKRKWHELDLICRSGIGIEPIMPALCRVLRELVGAEAASMFLLGDDRMPSVFYHEDADQTSRDLFLNEFERHFLDCQTLNFVEIAHAGGKKVGNLIDPRQHWFTSNTYNLLIRPNGHHHIIDMRVEVDGAVRAMVVLFRASGAMFTEQDAQTLGLASKSLELAIGMPATQGNWTSTGRKGYMIVDGSGERLLLLSGEAETLLKENQMVGEGIRLDGPITRTPRFVRELCRRLPMTPRPSNHLAIQSGRLSATAEGLHAPSPGNEPGATVLVSLEEQIPRTLHIVRNILGTDISPLRREIALIAAQERPRTDALAKVGMSNEALKKHLGELYVVTGVNSWEDLGQYFR